MRTAPSRSGRSRPACRSTCWPICGRCPKPSDPVERAEHLGQLSSCWSKLKFDLLTMPANRDRRAAARANSPICAEPLLELNKCPDFVVNRGHYFGNGQTADEPSLSDDDKHALIEFLKTF